MRSAAQVIGWIWVVFISLAILYDLFTVGLNKKLLMLLVVNAVTAIPGVLLILWGRKPKGKATDVLDEEEE
jgi:hypothetical protein